MAKVDINVVNPKQQDLADLFIERWDAHKLEIIGKGNHRITVRNPATDEEHAYTYSQFENLLERLVDGDIYEDESWFTPAEDVTTSEESAAEIEQPTYEQGADIPLPAEDAVAAEQYEKVKNLELVTPEPMPKIELGTAGPIAEARKEVQKATADLLVAIQQEHSSEYGKNASRLIKGRTLTMLERAAGTLKKFHAEEIEGMTPLQFARSWVEEYMENHGIFDTRLDDSEVYVTRKVYRALEDEGGVDAKFTDHYALNPKTQQPLVRDDGEPYVRSVTEVAMNKLWYVADVLQHDLDRVVSFAHRLSEKELKEFKRLKPEKLSANVVLQDIETISNGRITKLTDDGSEVEVPWDAPRIREYVNNKLGVSEDVKEEFRNITVPKDFYDSEYREAREMATVIMGFLGHENDLDAKTGMLKNVLLLGPILRTYFNVAEFGPWRLLEMFVNSGTITSKQAAYFRAAWEQEGLKEQWEQQHGGEGVPGFAEVYDGDEEAAIPSVEPTPEDGDDEPLPF